MAMPQFVDQPTPDGVRRLKSCVIEIYRDSSPSLDCVRPSSRHESLRAHWLTRAARSLWNPGDAKHGHREPDGDGGLVLLPLAADQDVHEQPLRGARPAPAPRRAPRRALRAGGRGGARRRRRAGRAPAGGDGGPAPAGSGPGADVADRRVLPVDWKFANTLGPRRRGTSPCNPHGSGGRRIEATQPPLQARPWGCRAAAGRRQSPDGFTSRLPASTMAAWLARACTAGAAGRSGPRAVLAGPGVDRGRRVRAADRASAPLPAPGSRTRLAHTACRRGRASRAVCRESVVVYHIIEFTSRADRFTDAAVFPARACCFDAACRCV